jgi:bleomycin hydrolase
MKKTIVITILYIAGVLNAQNTISNKKDGGFVFTPVKMASATSVKNQFKSGTCWTYSTNSFLESEILRTSKKEVDLSEMYIVRTSYSEKAKRFVRMMGKTQFAEGGEFHDVMRVFKENGLVPQSAYPGYQDKFEHGEMDKVMRSVADAIVDQAGKGKLTTLWPQAINGLLDGYCGKLPETFNYEGKSYTPKSFANSLSLNPDDYVEITSFTHHPMYSKFVLEVPDNWAWSEVYNVPLDELRQIAEYAIANGHTIAWASDVSEKGFSFKNGVAIVPEKDWDIMNAKEKEEAFLKPNPEMKITPEIRQTGFDNLTTQDDHGMHIVGMAKDQNGNNYYAVKNSWGTENDLSGYLYVSTPYFLYKTTSILVHKDAIPQKIAVKLKL